MVANFRFRIEFNSTHIQSMDDWYPHICRSLTQQQLVNTHIFHVITTSSALVAMEIYNFRINDMDFGDPDGLMAILWIDDSNEVHVYNSVFSDIRCFSGLDSWNYKLSSFWHSHSTEMNNVLFTNVSLIKSIVPFISSHKFQIVNSI